MIRTIPSFFFLAFLLFICTLGTCTTVAEVLPRADVTYDRGITKATPDFQRHVLPLLGRLGCNGRACHGSFEGQGGLRLSLFGYDFTKDHQALLAGDDEPRVDTDNAKESLILRKPTMQEDHDGGKRMEAGSWEYHLLRRWIEEGAAPTPKDGPRFVKLQVTPEQITFDKKGDTAQLRVIAHWSDGTQEDVTPLCRYKTNDKSQATVDLSGNVTAVGRGDTHIVAFYDNGVVPVEVVSPVSDRIGKNYPAVPTPTKIDRLVDAKLRRLGMIPSELSTDAEFLRRATIDIAGTLPTPEEVTKFLADRSKDKRTEKIDELLARPAHAAWWATKLCDLTGASVSNLTERDFRKPQYHQWYHWIYTRLRNNVPYDDLVAGIVVARSRPADQSYDEYCKTMTSYFAADSDADFSKRESMPYYWQRRNMRKSEEKALSIAYAFLGIRLQCAQCHKHPFDQWTKQDFNQFKAFFDGVTYGLAKDSRKQYREMLDDLGLADKKGGQLYKSMGKLVEDGKVVPWKEVFYRPPPNFNPRRSNKNKAKAKKKKRRPTSRVFTPKLLGGEEVLAAEYSDPRMALMQWMRADDNPYFARAFVNRVWAHYFGVGIVDPPDDLNLANPPSNRALLDYLSDEFTRRGYDIRWLHREITSSRTYQLSWRTNETNQNDRRNFSHAILRRLPAEVLYDAVTQATASADENREFTKRSTESAIGLGVSSNYKARGKGSYMMVAFGRPPRTTNCDCERSTEPSLLQTMFLRNDFEMLALIERKGGWLSQMGLKGRAAGSLPFSPERLAKTLKYQKKRLAKAEKDDNYELAAKMKTQIAATKKRLAKIRRVEAKSKKKRSVAKKKPAKINMDHGQLIRQAYLRTLGRLPNDSETARNRQYLAEAKDTSTGLRDVLWALLNTKEFLINH
jgi:hypothetical protein